MKVSEVTKDDCKMLAQIINMMQVGEFTVNGKDVCASADTIRWLQRFAVSVSETFSKEQKPTAEVPVTETKPPEAPPPTGGLPAGVKVKSFGRGKVK